MKSYMTFDMRVEEAFVELNAKLAKEDVSLTVICVGGYVLSHYGMRTTKDVDGFFRSTEIIDKAIQEVGEKLHLNSDDERWLNNSVQNMNVHPSEDICDVLYEFSNLKILMAPLEYIAGMKLTSAREQDIRDAASIVKRQGIDNPLTFLKTLQEFGFNRIDISVLLEAFGEAYGMKWLEEYYIQNEETLIRLV